MQTVRPPLVEKRCCKCGEIKLSSFFAKRSAIPSGLQSTCKDCQRARRAGNKELIARQAKEYRLANKDKIAAGIRRWEAANKEKVIERWRRWEVKNKERRKEMRLAAREANPSAFKARRDSYLNKHKEKFAAIFRFHAAMRRKRIREQEIAKRYKEDIAKIYRECPKGLHVDHIVPIAGTNVCGLHVPWNLQYLSPEENRRKRNSHAND